MKGNTVGLASMSVCGAKNTADRGAVSVDEVTCTVIEAVVCLVCTDGARGLTKFGCDVDPAAPDYESNSCEIHSVGEMSGLLWNQVKYRDKTPPLSVPVAIPGL